MTKTQAHKSITEKAKNGLISLEEAGRFHAKIDKIAVSKRSWYDKKSLYEVYA